MYKFNWTSYLDCNIDFIIQEFKKDQPDVVAFDTETTGLNIVKDIPFLFVVAWKEKSTNQAKVFVLEWTTRLKELYVLFQHCKFIVGQNTKYDLHLSRNGGVEFPFEILNDNCLLTDIRILRRLTMEADVNIQDEKMALKQMAKKFIDPNADEYEKEIKEILRTTNLKNRKIANTMLAPYKIKINEVEKVINDSRYGIETLNHNVKLIYQNWLKDFGPVNYHTIYLDHKKTMQKYALRDGVYTLELFYKFWLDLENDANKINKIVWTIFKKESKLIPIYYEQEKIGLKIDLAYLQSAKIRLANYIGSLERKLHLICEQVVSENQHKELMNILMNKFDIPQDFFLVKGKMSLDKSVLHRLVNQLPKNHPAYQATLLVRQLRTSRKWLSTYIDTIYKEVLDNGDSRYHPSNNQVGTVSGRISSNFQQMPRSPLLDFDGNELFNPRKMVVPSGNGYPYLVLQDFDQMELRVQADYTINFNCPDENMCKIFIPFNCVNVFTNEKFDIYNQEHLQNWNAKDKEGNSVWFDPKTSTRWSPTDPHGLHVKTAFGLDETSPKWKELRTASKTINFAVNYGSGLRNLLENPSLESFDASIIEKIFASYKQNFPGVGQYQKFVNAYVQRNGFILNRYGRPYKLKDTELGYKCANYLIQGSCADLVKECLLIIDKFLKTNNYKSRILLTIHDEIMWEVHKDEIHIIKEIENILTHAAKWSKIPLTCGTDIAITNWFEKRNIDIFEGIL